MIKNCTYIKKFTPHQKELLEGLSVKLKIKNASDILLYLLENNEAREIELARKQWIIEYKQRKIERLENQHGQTRI